MAERMILIEGGSIYRQFIDDLSQVMEHAYDIDEIFSLYGDWVRQGERFVDEFAMGLYSADKECPSDDFIGLRNAMLNLYCTLDTELPGLDRRRVKHAAYSMNDEAVVITTA